VDAVSPLPRAVDIVPRRRDRWTAAHAGARSARSRLDVVASDPPCDHLPISFEGFIVSLIIFGVTALTLGVLSRTGAGILIGGAVLFFLGRLLHGPFWSENDPKPDSWFLVIYLGSLLLIGAGWVLLGSRPTIGHRRQPLKSVVGLVASMSLTRN
jgi:hypothetical protein